MKDPEEMKEIAEKQDRNKRLRLGLQMTEKDLPYLHLSKDRVSFEDSGLSKEYEDRWNNNPYWKLYDSVERKGIGEITGKNKKLQQQYKQLALEYEEGLRREMAENEYNSPEQQLARNNAAGINSDLAGTGDVNEDAGFNEPESTAVDLGPTDYESITGFAEKTISTYFTIANGIQGLAGVTIANRAKQIGLDNEIWKITGNAATAGLDWQNTENGKGDNGETLEGGKVTASWGTYLGKMLFPGNSNYDKKQRKKVESFYNRQMNSLQNAVNLEKGLEERGRSIASGYGHNDMSGVGNKMAGIYDIMADASKLQLEIQMKFDEARKKLAEDKDYIGLYTNAEKMELSKKYSVAYEEKSEADFNRGVLEAMGAEGQQAEADAKVEAWKASKQEAMRKEKEEDIEMVKLYIQYRVWELAKNNPGQWMLEYGPIVPALGSPNKAIYNEAKGGKKDDGPVTLETVTQFAKRMGLAFAK